MPKKPKSLIESIPWYAKSRKTRSAETASEMVSSLLDLLKSEPPPKLPKKTAPLKDKSTKKGKV